MIIMAVVIGMCWCDMARLFVMLRLYQMLCFIIKLPHKNIDKIMTH